jgi:hypothetical protein
VTEGRGSASSSLFEAEPHVWVLSAQGAIRALRRQCRLDLKLNYISLLILLLVAFTAIYESIRRRRIAIVLATNWLSKNGFLIRPGFDVRANTWGWPVRVSASCFDELGQRVDIVLRVGSFFGGVFAGKVKCESMDKYPAN